MGVGAEPVAAAVARALGRTGWRRAARRAPKDWTPVAKWVGDRRGPADRPRTWARVGLRPTVWSQTARADGLAAGVAAAVTPAGHADASAAATAVADTPLGGPRWPAARAEGRAGAPVAPPSVAADAPGGSSPSETGHGGSGGTAGGCTHHHHGPIGGGRGRARSTSPPQRRRRPPRTAWCDGRGDRPPASTAGDGGGAPPWRRPLPLRLPAGRATALASATTYGTRAKPLQRGERRRAAHRTVSFFSLVVVCLLPRAPMHRFTTPEKGKERREKKKGKNTQPPRRPPTTTCRACRRGGPTSLG